MNGYSASFERSADWTWQQKLYGYFSLARISNSPTVITNVLAGAALAGALNSRNAIPIILIALAMVAFYTAGMYFNDLCDYEFDCLKRSDRPLPSGLISRSSAVTVTIGLFVVGSVMLLSVGMRPFVAGLLLIALIIAYDAWHKTNPLSPVLMASTRMMVYIVAFLAFSSSFSTALLLSIVLLMSYIVGLTAIAKSESGKSLVRYWPMVALFLPVLVFAFYLSNPAVLTLLLAFCAWIAYCVSFVYRKQGRSIGGAIARLIAGISIYDGLVMAVSGFAAYSLLALIGFGLTLVLQRYVKGT